MKIIKKYFVAFQLLFCNIYIPKYAFGQGECRIALQFPSVEPPLFLSDAAPKPSLSPILETGTESFFLFPENTGPGQQLLKRRSKGELTIACPGKGNKLATRNGNFGEIACGNNGQVSIDNEDALEEEISCLKRPSGSIFQTNERCQGERQGILHVIGFQISKDWFIPLITVCWDKKKETTLFTQHTVYGKALKQRVASPGRPSSFMPAKLYSQPIDSLYKKNTQLKNFGRTLGDSSFVPGTATYYLARGHLAPDADFVLPAEQDTTYFYSNVVPQFQDFNNGNWKVLEEAIRALAVKVQHPLTVFTGTMGILTLKDENGNEVEIYLDSKKNLYPAPLVMWKVVHDPSANKAVAILGLNFVHEDAERETEFFSLCNDVCNQLSWARWDSTDWKRGLVICCSWKDFQKLVPITPVNFGKVTLLTG